MGLNSKIQKHDDTDSDVYNTIRYGTSSLVERNDDPIFDSDFDEDEMRMYVEDSKHYFYDQIIPKDFYWFIP